MSLDNIPARSNGQTIDQTWFNLIEAVLSQALVPRDVNGTIGDTAGALGTASYRWSKAYLEQLLVGLAGKQVTLDGSLVASPYTLKLPDALPGSTGLLRLAPDGAISAAASTLQKSSSSGAFDTASASYVDVTNLSVTITTTGRPVWLFLVSDATSGGNGLTAVSGGSPGVSAFFALVRASTKIMETQVGLSGTASFMGVPAGTFSHVDPVAAGTYTYKVQAKVITGTDAGVRNCYLCAIEL